MDSSAVVRAGILLISNQFLRECREFIEKKRRWWEHELKNESHSGINTLIKKIISVL